MIYAITFGIIPVAITGYIVWRIWRDKKLRDSEKWVVPIKLLDALLPKMEATMVVWGYGKGDYNAAGKTCVQFAARWMEVLDLFLKAHRPDGQREWKRQYSFKRDDGKFHRVVAIKTTAGIKYIESYRINGSLYRELSVTEEQNGTAM